MDKNKSKPGGKKPVKKALPIRKLSIFSKGLRAALNYSSNVKDLN